MAEGWSFKKSLDDAFENPNEKSSIEMNHKVLRIMSFSGKELKCLLFERSQSKSKLIGFSMRNGFQSIFMTIALP